MKVGLIHHQFAKKGGMERYIFDLIQGFGDRGDQIDMFVYKKDPELEQPLHCNIHQKKINWLPRKLRKYFFANILSKEISDANCDLVFSTMRTFTQDINVCGGTHPGYIKFMNKRKNLFDHLEIVAERKGFSASNKIVAHSNLIRDEILHFYNMPSEKVIRLFPPVNTSFFNHAHRQLRGEYQKKFSIDPTKCTLLFPSTGHRRKGLFELLEAFKGLSDQYELLIAGDDFPSAKALSNVRCLGFVEDMAALYTAVDGMILPSHYEPFGLVVSEAMACGTPVIISRFVGAKDLVDDSSGIVIQSVTPSEIRGACESFYTKDFDVSLDFVSKYQLGLKDHIDSLIMLKGDGND